MAISTTLALFLLLSTPLLPTSLSQASPTTPRRFSKIFAFGDSFTDTGNTGTGTGPFSFGFVSNFPYGVTFFHRPTNRYSDGRLVVDFLASALSLPFLPPYRNAANPNSGASNHGVNFAVAGSTALDHDFFVKNNVTIDVTPESLSTELGWFERYLEEKGCRVKGLRECEEVMEGALFWVGEIGVNDYAYSLTSTVSPDLIRDLALQNEFNFLQALLDKGAKYMVVQGMPLVGCLPLTMVLTSSEGKDDIGCSATVNNLTYIHNTLLQSRLQELRRKYPAAIISYADYFSAHRLVMKKPSLYGFTEEFMVCCGAGGAPYNYELFSTCGSPDVQKACSDPAKFVNWDGVHLTEAVYKVVADMFFHHGYLHPSFDVLIGSKEQVAS